MKIDTSEKWLPIYEALSSSVRLKIINILSEKPHNIREIALKLGLSSAIITMHINKLEKAKIIKTERSRSRGGIQKICSLDIDKIEILFPELNLSERKFHDIMLPVGQYTDIEAVPTCGIATDKKVIGYFDDPRYFLDPDRVNAKILWFTVGHVEYTIPNYLLSNETPEEVEISLEISSEAPGYNKNWPSDITFFINDINLGTWTSPGDFGGKRGKYTPSWWGKDINQYGMLKIIKINKFGSFIDGEKISDVTIDALDVFKKKLTFKIAVLNTAKNRGGVTIFGSNFGNYNQDIHFKIYYK